MPLSPSEAISLSPAAIKAGKELGEAVDAIRDALSPKGAKGAKITKAEAGRIAREAKQAIAAGAKLLVEIAIARRS